MVKLQSLNLVLWTYRD